MTRLARKNSASAQEAAKYGLTGTSQLTSTPWGTVGTYHVGKGKMIDVGTDGWARKDVGVSDRLPFAPGAVTPWFGATLAFAADGRCATYDTSGAVSPVVAGARQVDAAVTLGTSLWAMWTSDDGVAIGTQAAAGRLPPELSAVGAIDATTALGMVEHDGRLLCLVQTDDTPEIWSADPADPMNPRKIADVYGPELAPGMVVVGEQVWCRTASTLCVLDVDERIPIDFSDHADLFVSQWRNAPRFMRLADELIAVANEQGAAIDAMEDQANVARAMGVWLDRIGARVGIRRPFVDESYPTFGFQGSKRGTDKAGNPADVAFDAAPYLDGARTLQPVPVADKLYRKAIRARGMAITSRTSANDILQALAVAGVGIGDADDSLTSTVTEDIHTVTVKVDPNDRNVATVLQNASALPKTAGVDLAIAP